MSYVYKVYINDIYQGETSSTHWNLSQIYTTPPTPFGAGYYLPMSYSTRMYWRIDTYDTETELTTTGYTWAFTTKNATLPGSSSYFIGGEWQTVIPNKGSVWDSLLEEWVDTFGLSWQFVDGIWQWTSFPDVKGGGRYQNNVFLFGIDENGVGKISYA